MKISIPWSEFEEMFERSEVQADDSVEHDGEDIAFFSAGPHGVAFSDEITEE